MDMGVCRGEGGVNGKARTDNYTTTCKTDSQWETGIYSTEFSSVLCGDLEG